RPVPARPPMCAERVRETRARGRRRPFPRAPLVKRQSRREIPFLPGDSYLVDDRSLDDGQPRAVFPTCYPVRSASPPLAWSWQPSLFGNDGDHPTLDREGDRLMDKSFLTDIKELRRRARSHIEQGAITAAYRGD